jgi:hypothetical protein
MYVSSTDANTVIQDMSAFASDDGISSTSLSDTAKVNEDLMTVVAGSWQG